jgi:integral membrane protein (TIGR01906 family)
VAFVRQVAALVFIIALPVALVTTTIRIVANEPRLYSYAADHYDTPETTGIERSELLRASGELRDYFNNGDDAVFIRVRKDGDLISLFNPRETAHLRDVKSLFQASFRMQEGTVVFVLAYVVGMFIWAREGTLRGLAKQLLISSALGVVVIGLLGAVIATGFDAAFERFHLIFFTNDLWQLDPDRDRLIQMFPEGFWQDVTLWVGIATLAELGLLALGSLAYLGLSRRAALTYTLPATAQPQAQH